MCYANAHSQTWLNVLGLKFQAPLSGLRISICLVQIGGSLVSISGGGWVPCRNQWGLGGAFPSLAAQGGYLFAVLSKVGSSPSPSAVGSLPPSPPTPTSKMIPHVCASWEP